MMASMPTLPHGLLPRTALTLSQRDEMFALLAGHFTGVTRDQFECDLGEKNWVVEVRREGRLLGFSTLLAETVEFEGRFLTAIYSGDTIVAPEAWNSPALARAWIGAVHHLRAAHPGQPCYWLLLTSGFRTYRFLSVFWRRFFPQHDVATPPEMHRLLRHLAGTHYGTLYDETAGIVRFPHPQILDRSLGQVPAGRLNDPHVAFFLQKNSGHALGDELVCLAELSDENLTPAGLRVVAASMR
jgi:hypothetical protein